MEWEDKVKLIQLGNKNSNSKEDRVEFQNHVLEHINAFDIQAWSMFGLSTSIMVDEMKEDIDYWSKIHPLLKDVDLGSQGLGMSDSMRLSMLQVICKDELGFE